MTTRTLTADQKAKKNQIAFNIAAILTTLNDPTIQSGIAGAPSSTLYLGLGMTLDEYNWLIGFMAQADFIENDNHWVTLTARGKALAVDLQKTLDDAPVKPSA